MTQPSSFFNTVHIQNFKSLKDVTLKDCKRINLLIGKPNVGKSNILEAIGLFSLPYIKESKDKKITQFIRLENLAELFSDGDIEKKIHINSDDGSSCIATYIPERGFVTLETNIEEQNLTYYNFEKPLLTENKNNQIHSITINNQLNIVEHNKKQNYILSKVKYYKFSNVAISKGQDSALRISSLIPPHGINFFDVVQYCKVKLELSEIFAEYGLKLLFDKTNRTLRIIKLLDDAIVSFPYSSIADTLQRVIFFKTAIASNKNSIILFEEPEAHCFPPYITHIAREIIDSESNQFFIATHSPFILDTFLENSRNDLAIFMADFRDGQTVIKRLTDNEVNDVYEYGLDLFFNSELFTDEI